MFDKILIANRGEIACRVIKSAEKMGIKTVAVYSDADKMALHVKMADEAVCIGLPAAAQSYLLADKIIQACKDTGAQAVHPGYGFLSENVSFYKALKEEGIAFIGPGELAIECMGDKMASKKLAMEAGVNVVPGYPDLIEDADQAVKVAAEIGYPVMIKASAGGGGKGMRVAFDEKECRSGYERAKNEAASSFGDDRILMEKFIEQPRHIEIQIMADSHGNTIYLGERECSIQRRHQKIIEEAPSPFIDKATRKSMGEQAVALAKAVDYQSAGTVEFIVDSKHNFYFLEMNTRLQVEHPVTEKITGLDLVELMIMVAAGEELPLTQKDVILNGWAMETRIYAEDPARGFLPSIGRLTSYLLPELSEHVRVDTGVVEGGEVSIHYDPMIAKLITHGKGRKEAIEYMKSALDAFHIRGIKQNISFLNAIMSHERFASGDITTNFIAEEYPDGFSADVVPQVNPAHQIVVAATMYNIHKIRANKLSGQFTGSKRRPDDDWIVLMDGKEYQVRVELEADSHFVRFEGEDYMVTTNWQFGQPLFHCTINNEPLTFQVERDGVWYNILHRGARKELLVLTKFAAALYTHMPEKAETNSGKFHLSPMPGLIIKISVEEGQELKAGEELAVIEAMKMENVLTAERDVKIAKILVDLNESVSVDQPIIEFE
jgi:propionyl-CoA carboxylase alpha subunit